MRNRLNFNKFKHSPQILQNGSGGQLSNTIEVSQDGKPAHRFLAIKRYQLVHGMAPIGHCHDFPHFNYCHSHYLAQPRIHE